MSGHQKHSVLFSNCNIKQNGKQRRHTIHYDNEVNSLHEVHAPIMIIQADVV